MMELKIVFVLTPDAIYKSARVAKIFAKEDLDFTPEYRNVRFFLECIPALILCPASTNTVLKKRSGK